MLDSLTIAANVATDDEADSVADSPGPETDSRPAVPDAAAPAAAAPRGPLRRLRARLSGDRGAATAEYAVATMAAVGFAGLLVVILRGDEVRGILTDLVRNALTVG
ncbi:Protein of unknown function [Agromyces sp. CF514]|uniref:DUF4244 domain-containing protein n=1 Tax=Agromyces sp. CF514 TaxID=1881031 RepID=UPI0008E46F6D|nr:DUF4244 domain-containing protein [Agromyces sp. CF514]SFR85495.1 Protein of unknown function [Agromyces sp. CF514]